MKSNTQVLNIGDTFEIVEDMGVMQFCLIGLSDTTQFTYLGTAPVSTGGVSIDPTEIPFTGQVAYNSRVATNMANPWTNVIIKVSAGAVGLELLQN